MGYKKGAQVKTSSVFKTQATPSVSTSNSLRNTPQLLPSGWALYCAAQFKTAVSSSSQDPWPMASRYPHKYLRKMKITKQKCMKSNGKLINY